MILLNNFTPMLLFFPTISLHIHMLLARFREANECAHWFAIFGSKVDKIWHTLFPVFQV